MDVMSYQPILSICIQMGNKMWKDMQQRILQATIELIMLDGLEKLSINKVIKSAGSSKGSFYYYFDGIDDLLQQVFLYSLHNSLMDFKYEKGQSLKEILLHFGQYLINISKNKSHEQSFLFLWLSKCYQDPLYRTQFQIIRKQIVEDNWISKCLIRDYELESTWLYTMDVLVIGFLAHCALSDDEQFLMQIWEQLVHPLII